MTGMMRPTGYEPLYCLKPVADDVWIVDGGRIRFYGIPFPTRMTVIRLANGKLWVHSPIADEGGLLAAVAALGEVGHLVAPNWIHYAWMPLWQSRFPHAMSWGCPGVVERAASRKIKLKLDQPLQDVAPAAWSSEIDQRLADSGIHKEVVFFHQASRTLILTDLIESLEADKMPWWIRPFLGLGRVRHPDGRMPLDIAASFWKRPDHLRAVVQTMIGWNPERVIFAHGQWYQTNGTAELQRAFRGVVK